jgi:hypothetical protein
MSNEPVVRPLVEKLSFSSWLKPFFIHPSVTLGAQENMDSVRWAQERLAEERKEKQDRADMEKTLGTLDTILNSIQTADVKAEEDSNLLAAIGGLIQASKPNVVAHSAPEFADEEDVSSSLHSTLAPREVDLDELKDISNKIFLNTLKLKDAALRHRFLQAFVKASPQHKAIVDMVAIIERQNDEGLTSHFNRLLSSDIYTKESSQQIFRAKLTEIFHNTQNLLRDNDPAIAEFNKAREILNPDSRSAQLKVVRYHPAVVLPYVSHESFGSIVKGAFWKAIGFDGYESTSTLLTDAKGKKHGFKASTRWHALFTFLGFPTRFHSDADGKAQYDWRAFFRNALGGWESLYNRDLIGNRFSRTSVWWLNPRNYTFEGKRFWNFILLVTGVKLVIAAFHLAAVPFRLARNVLKLVTEVLPQVLLQYSGTWYGLSASIFPSLYYGGTGLTRRTKVLRGIFAALIFIVSAPIHHIARIWALVGAIVTSPEKSAREAWRYGLALDSRLGIVFATLGAATSIALTAIFWALTFPLVFAKALVLFPALAPVVTSIAQLPIVARTLAFINGTAVLVAGTLPAAFSLAATAISTAFGVTVSATTLAVATTAAFIAAPVAVIATRLADELSNAWTRWRAYMTLPEAVSVAVADVAVTATTAVLHILPSENTSDLKRRLQIAYDEAIKIHGSASKMGRDNNEYYTNDNRVEYLELPEAPAKYMSL